MVDLANLHPASVCFVLRRVSRAPWLIQIQIVVIDMGCCDARPDGTKDRQCHLVIPLDIVFEDQRKHQGRDPEQRQ